MRQKNGIEPLTQTTVYPDTIWRERKQNGEIKTERRKGGKERKRETFIDPSKYILQTTKHFSGATIRGQALSQDHPFFSPLSDPLFIAFLCGRTGKGNSDKDIIVVSSYLIQLAT